MRGKTHCTIGILSTIQACILFKIPISIFNIVVAAIFSILPDLDESNSTISNVFLNSSKTGVITLLISVKHLSTSFKVLAISLDSLFTCQLL